MADFQTHFAAQNFKTVQKILEGNSGVIFANFWVFVPDSWEVTCNGLRFVRHFTKTCL
jgi:hypothetical protein